MRTRIIGLCIMMVLLCGCKKDNPTPEKEQRRTVLIYMIANNSLSSYAIKDINEMEAGWDDSFQGNLLVFLNEKSGKNYLYQISNDYDLTSIGSKIIKTYPASSEVCTEEFLQEVISDVKSLYPADSYALDLWSHGSGWLPYNQKNPLTIADLQSKYFNETEINCIREPSETFGVDNTNDGYFETYDLADALSPYKFDFILFDACHMGSIECAYQMKDICTYYISSASETIASGFPYDEIVEDMFSQPANVVSIADKFYQYYKKETGTSATATVSVVECSKLQDVATELNKIVTKTSVPASSIQQYGREKTGYNNCFYDLEDFVQKTWGEDKSSSFSNALSNAVIYKAATPMLLGVIEIKHHSGLSCYIPYESQKKTLSIYRNYYSWAEESGLLKMVE